MDNYRYLSTSRQAAVLVTTLVNPPRNFLHAGMVAELTDLVSKLEGDRDVRALVLTGGIEGIFITHYDVGELVAIAERIQGGRPPPGGAQLHAMHNLLLKLQRLSQPVIAAINGTAMGGGCELALACDFRLMAKYPGAVIGLPEVRIAIIPGAGGTQRMTRLLGIGRAMELMVLGKTIDPDTAERIGLIHRSVDSSRLLDEALALGSEIAKRPAASVALIKQCILRGIEMSLEEALHLEQDAFWDTMRAPDALRLMRAYLTSDRPLDQQ